MRKKWNLALSVATITLTMAIFAFGVYAALTTSFSISNNISFSPTSIAVDITGTVSGYEGEEDTLSRIGNYEYFYDVLKNDNQPPENWNDVKLKSLTFKNSNTPIVFEFTLKSKTNIEFNVYIVEDAENNNAEFIINEISHSQSNPLAFTEEGQEKTMTLTVRVKDVNKGFNNIKNNFTISIIPAN